MNGEDVRPGITPVPISNRPALDAIEYRVGTYASFRRTMLEQVGRWKRIPDEDAADSAVTRPLARWTTRSDDDFGIAFVEMWAYLADVLTFYQERIANEAYLRTAVDERSTTFLVSLIGYRPASGRAATAYLAFETEKDAAVRLDEGLLVQSVPGQDEKPQKFETLSDLEALPALNLLLPRTMESQRLPRGATRAVLAGTGHQIAAGDWIAIAGNERRRDPGSERWDLRRVAEAVEDKEARTTTVSWTEGLGDSARPWRGAISPDPEPEFWVFRGQAWPFGYNAPDYNLFAIPTSEATQNIANAFKAAFPDWSAKSLPEDGARPEHLYLDTVYTDITPGGWVALVTSSIGAAFPELRGYDEYVELYPVVDVADTSHRNYTLTGKSTRVTLDTMPDGPNVGKPEHIGYFPLQGTVALIQSERIDLAEVAMGHSAVDPDASVLTPVHGTWIELDGSYPDLRPGRTLLVAGTLIDTDGRPLGPGAETVVVAAVDGTDRTIIRFGLAMTGRYERGTVLIFGNVAQASHGESVRSEIVGDGDASVEFQGFALKKHPVTYIPAAGAPGGVADTLELRVDGIAWRERAELYGQPPDARVYVTRRDPDETMHVLFGDGRQGARPASGRNNITARYRVGLGPEGNVGADTLRTLLKKPLGLKRVSNPAPAAGGARAEDPAAVKDNAPGTVRTFGRIVSIRDFEDAAREYVGVAKARARFTWDGEGRVVDLVVAGDDGVLIDIAASGLRADLDARRDPHQPLGIRNYARIDVVVRLSIIVDDVYLPETVRAAADLALRGLFAFEAIDLGQAVHLSDVYRAVQRVDGVVAVDVDDFRLKTAAAGTVAGRLPIAPSELVWVAEPEDLAVTDARLAGRATA